MLLPHKDALNDLLEANRIKHVRNQRNIDHLMDALLKAIQSEGLVAGSLDPTGVNWRRGGACSEEQSRRKGGAEDRGSRRAT